MAQTSPGAPASSLPGFSETRFEGLTVFRRGSGPGVVVMHEIPGITPETIRFAGQLADAGFTVALPQLFGEAGRAPSPRYVVDQLAACCIRRELAVWAADRSSPIVDRLRSLCRALHAELGGRGVGAIGMCITGNFALAMLVEPALMAPVLSQPSLPLPLSARHRAALHVSPAELACAKRRVAEGVRVLGLRFSGDVLCPRDRFARLRRELGAGFEGVEIDSSLFNPHGIPPLAHSVLTGDLVDRLGHPTRAALDRVIAFLKEQLAAPPAPR